MSAEAPLKAIFIPIEVVESLLQLGYAMGFMASFDGWNGQAFKDHGRKLEDSEIFMAKMNEAVFSYILNNCIPQGDTSDATKH